MRKVPFCADGSFLRGRRYVGDVLPSSCGGVTGSFFMQAVPKFIVFHAGCVLFMRTSLFFHAGGL